MKRTTITISSVQEGMITAKDIFTADGILLIPEDTPLTPTHIIKMSVYNITSISVFVDDSCPGMVDPVQTFGQELRAAETQEVYGKTITDSKQFKEFAKRYDNQVKMVEYQLTEIIHSNNIDLKPVYELISEILSTTAASMDFFSFMCRMKSSDDVTYSHSMNVSMMACILGKWMNLPAHQTTELALSGMLHDIGKVLVDQSVLNKEGKLTDDEYTHIKEHTTLGYEIVSMTDIPIGVKHAILMHHEKMNGAGYPLGLSWNRIHQYAKIISIVDIYDAMTAERPYHRRYHPFHVINMFEEECYGILDTDILYIFLERIAHNFMNDRIRLDNGEEGKIIFIHHRNPSRPIVQLDNGKIIDLLNTTNLGIKDFL